MIVGIGTDCCAVGRIADAIDRHGDRFLRRVFTNQEREAASRRGELSVYFARRFAAKEACAKALRSGITERIGWCDMEILNGPSGEPVLRLLGGALERVKALTPKDHEIVVHVSLTDDPPIAIAFVVLEARAVNAPAVGLAPFP